MRQKYNLELERLYDKNGMKFERKTYNMMPSQIVQQEKENEGISAQDFQDEDKIAELMNKVLYLTEEDIK